MVRAVERSTRSLQRNASFDEILDITSDTYELTVVLWGTIVSRTYGTDKNLPGT